MTFIVVKNEPKLLEIFGDLKSKAQGANEQERTFQAAMFDFWLRDWTEEEVSELFTFSRSTYMSDKYKNLNILIRGGTEIKLTKFGFEEDAYHIHKPDSRPYQSEQHYVMNWFNIHRDWAIILNNMRTDFPDALSTKAIINNIPWDKNDFSLNKSLLCRNSIFHNTILDRLVLIKNNFFAIDRNIDSMLYFILKTDNDRCTYSRIDYTHDIKASSKFIRNNSNTSNSYFAEMFFLNYSAYARHFVNLLMPKTYGGFVDVEMRNDKTPQCVFFKNAKDRESIMTEDINSVFDLFSSKMGQVTFSQNLLFGHNKVNYTVHDKPRVKNKITKFTRALNHVMRGVITDKLVEYTNMAVMERFYLRDPNSLTFNISSNRDAFYKATTGQTPKQAFNHTDSMIKAQANSCMRHDNIENGFHPSHAYATGDFYVGWLSCEESKDGKFYGRSYIGIQDMSKATDLFKSQVAHTFGNARAEKLKFVYVTGPCYTHTDACAKVYFNKLKEYFTSADSEVALGIASYFVTEATGIKYIGDGWNGLRMQYGKTSDNKFITFPYVDITSYSIGELNSDNVLLVDGNYKPPKLKLSDEQKDKLIKEKFSTSFDYLGYANYNKYYKIVLENEFSKLENFNPEDYFDVFKRYAKISQNFYLGQPRFSGGHFSGEKHKITGETGNIQVNMNLDKSMFMYTIDALNCALNNSSFVTTSISKIRYVASDVKKFGMQNYLTFSQSSSRILDNEDFASVISQYKEFDNKHIVHTYDGDTEASIEPTDIVIYGNPQSISYFYKKDIYSPKVNLSFAKIGNLPVKLLQLPDKCTVWKKILDEYTGHRHLSKLDPATDILILNKYDKYCSDEQAKKSIMIKDTNMMLDIMGYTDEDNIRMYESNLFRTTYKVVINGVVFRAVRIKENKYMPYLIITVCYRDSFTNMPLMFNTRMAEIDIDITITQNKRTRTGQSLLADETNLSDEQLV